ncbi:MAG: transposase [Deltaproteobacteria bacterium]|nr:transposase [Deltaproteobacteria bacterium]
MARQKREDFAGAWHHVMHRGARRAPIFKVPADCQGFVDAAKEMVSRFGVEVHAYALMPNHYHLLVRSVSGNLSEAMQYLNGMYTLWLNARHHWDGPVFRGRFRNQLVTAEGHLRILLAYIHLNPVEAHLVTRLSDQAWTSHRAYVGKEEAPEWLTTKLFRDLLGGPAKLHEFVLSYRRGVLEYPEDFNVETGLFGKKALAAVGTGRAVVKAGGRRASRREHPRLRNRQGCQVQSAGRGERAGESGTNLG